MEFYELDIVGFRYSGGEVEHGSDSGGVEGCGGDCDGDAVLG